MDAVVDVTDATFERDVLERSQRAPVVVDFWAAWCGPCRTLSPILERLAEEAAGGWTLAKVDVDANPGLAQAFRVQGIPAVHAFRGGREVARFVGALPEAEVRRWLEQLGPSTADLAMEEGRSAEDRGDVALALRAYRRALTDEPGRDDARAAVARLELARRSAGADPGDLRARLAADPSDVGALTGLADVAFAAGDVDAAFDLLLAAVRDGGDAREPARVHLLGLLDTLPPEDARALRARRELAAALF